MCVYGWESEEGELMLTPRSVVPGEEAHAMHGHCVLPL